MTPISANYTTPHSFHSNEQQVLVKIEKVGGNMPVSQFQPQFAPSWIVENPSQTEKESYAK